MLMLTEMCTIHGVHLVCEHGECQHKRREQGSQGILMLLNNEAVQAVFLGKNPLSLVETPSPHLQRQSVFIPVLHDHLDVLVRFVDVTEVSVPLFVEVFGDPVCARVTSIFR